ncbi:histone-like nucleoid-structuring protein Lsr2 [Pseudokineococcus sp. 1T1Z-3]|uniref:histone-like nucleoid-structuring protein Lsr2 n=1 Tax=Pseudokineococcus sp. 1T1Z-3 TaxID=3132745 RepID=UPI0030ACA22A
MVQKTEIVLTDDMDGSPASRTVSFAFEGVAYEIDLNDEHAAAIEESFAEWVAAARRTGTGGAAASGAVPARSSGRSGPKRSDLDAVRAWARDNGHSVSDRGRVAQKVLDAYDAAH